MPLFRTLDKLLAALPESVPGDWQGLGAFVLETTSHHAPTVMTLLRAILFFCKGRYTVLGWELHDTPDIAEYRALLRLARDLSGCRATFYLHEYYEGRLSRRKVEVGLRKHPNIWNALTTNW